MLRVARVFKAVNTSAESCGITKLGGRPFRVSDLETVSAIGGKIVGCTKLERTDSTTDDRVSAGDKMYIVYTEVSAPQNTKYCICVNDSTCVNEWIAVIPKHVGFADVPEDNSKHNRVCEPKVCVFNGMTITKVFKVVAIASVCVIAVYMMKNLMSGKADNSINGTQSQETKTVAIGGDERTYTYGAKIEDSGITDDNAENNATTGTKEFNENTSVDEILFDTDSSDTNATNNVESVEDVPHIPDDDTIDLVTLNYNPKQLNTVNSTDHLVTSDLPGFTPIVLSDTNKSYTFVNNTGWRMKVSLKSGKKKLASYSVERDSKLTQDISGIFNETCEVHVCYTFFNDKNDVVEEYSSKVMVYVI